MDRGCGHRRSHRGDRRHCRWLRLASSRHRQPRGEQIFRAVLGNGWDGRRPQREAIAVSSDLAAIQTSMERIARRAAANDLPGVLAATREFRTAVIRFEHDPPAPDAVERFDLARAMQAYEVGATEILNGDFAAGTAHIERGTRWINLATQRLQAINTAR